MATFISNSPEDTLALGEQWGRAVQAGWVIGLAGDLGAGKTQLVKGLARGLGSPARVHSPTFTLVNEYARGRLPLFHLDLYRLDGVEQIIAAGLEDYFRPRGVAVVEWFERWFEGVGASWWQTGAPMLRRVCIEITGETERRITYEDSGT
jgi:tRNA threonylcarbamoyladenosine biosynthesis protein TsaE